MATDSSIINILTDISTVPQKLYLKANYPNPSNPSTLIQFGLPETNHVRIIIFDMLGQEIKEIVNDTFDAGIYSVNWNGKNDFNQNVASGMYFYKLITREKILSRKMLLLR